jgi:ATP-dependent protease ClpP protease subunit
MLEVQIYDEIANKSEQVWLSAWGMEDCIFSADIVNKIFLDNPDEKDIKFNIHCNGGSVGEGLTIYDILRNSGRNIYMNVEGSCHSMAIVLLLAAPAENRTGNRNLRALVHRVYCPAMGYYTADELKSLSDETILEENAILDIYEERTGKNRAALAAWMKSEKQRTADELLDMNFISKINSYNTNFKRGKMKKNEKTAGKSGKNEVLKKSSSFLNRIKRFFAVNYDYTDSEGNVLFSTESEEDTLAVGDTVTISDGNTEGTFTLVDGRVVTIVDNTVTDIAEEAESETTVEVEALNAENDELRRTLQEAEAIITELRNHIQSDYVPGQRVVTKQNPSNARKTAEELKNEAKEKLKKARGGK